MLKAVLLRAHIAYRRTLHICNFRARFPPFKGQSLCPRRLRRVTRYPVNNGAERFSLALSCVSTENIERDIC